MTTQIQQVNLRNLTPNRFNKWKSQNIYSHASHNDVSVNDGHHLWRWSHYIILYYIILYYIILYYIILYYIILYYYHCVTIAYSIQYSNMLYRFV